MPLCVTCHLQRSLYSGIKGHSSDCSDPLRQETRIVQQNTAPHGEHWEEQGGTEAQSHPSEEQNISGLKSLLQQHPANQLNQTLGPINTSEVSGEDQGWLQETAYPACSLTGRLSPAGLIHAEFIVPVPGFTSNVRRHHQRDSHHWSGPVHQIKYYWLPAGLLQHRSPNCCQRATVTSKYLLFALGV